MNGGWRDSRYENVNIISEGKVATPLSLRELIPICESSKETVMTGSSVLTSILKGSDHRLFVIVGPCSIHDIISTVDYAKKLKVLSEELSESLFLIMRIYFEKPRTSIGWKGFLSDPKLDDSCDISEGLVLCRRLLHEVTGLGIAVASEALDLISPQYFQEYVSFSAIGARTSEAQTHRNMASGLSSVVGFKNSTSGDIDVAINGVKAASKPSVFLSVDLSGQVCVVRTKGNPNCHVILRGSSKEPNYFPESVKCCENKMLISGVSPRITIDCSHGNSGKDHNQQITVLNCIAEQIQLGNQSIVGVMLESNLYAGRQELTEDLTKLKYGISITDSCIGWDQTELCLRAFSSQVKNALRSRSLLQVCSQMMNGEVI